MPAAGHAGKGSSAGRRPSVVGLVLAATVAVSRRGLAAGADRLGALRVLVAQLTDNRFEVIGEAVPAAGGDGGTDGLEAGFRRLGVPAGGGGGRDEGATRQPPVLGSPRAADGTRSPGTAPGWAGGSRGSPARRRAPSPGCRRTPTSKAAGAYCTGRFSSGSHTRRCPVRYDSGHGSSRGTKAPRCGKRNRRSTARELRIVHVIRVRPQVRRRAVGVHRVDGGHRHRVAAAARTARLPGLTG